MMFLLYIFACLAVVMNGLVPIDHPGCIVTLPNGNICGALGYNNMGSFINITAGNPSNTFRIEDSEGTIDMILGDIGQPSDFNAGYWPGIFCAPFPDNIKYGDNIELSWTLGNLEASVSAYDELCINEDWTWYPTFMPSLNPSTTPTSSPTLTPTLNPTLNPTLTPTLEPTKYPTISPTNNPTLEPTLKPSNHPTDEDGEANIPEIDIDIDVDGE